MPHAVAVTELPEGYLDEKIAEQRKGRDREAEAERLRQASRERHARERQAREDAFVQFLYDETETVTGARVRVDEVAERYKQWAADNDRPSMRRELVQGLITQVGYGLEKGYMPDTPQVGAPPTLVTGLRLKGVKADTAPPATFSEPEVSKPAAPERTRVTVVGDKPGNELAKQL